LSVGAKIWLKNCQNFSSTLDNRLSSFFLSRSLNIKAKELIIGFVLILIHFILKLCTKPAWDFLLESVWHFSLKKLVTCQILPTCHPGLTSALGFIATKKPPGVT